MTGKNRRESRPTGRPWLQFLCRLTGSAFTGKDGIEYGDHSAFDDLETYGYDDGWGAFVRGAVFGIAIAVVVFVNL